MEKKEQHPVSIPILEAHYLPSQSYRPPTWNRKRLLEFLARSARVVMGYCAMEGFLRFAYVRSAALAPRWFFAQSGWTLAGIVYFSSLQFYLKYNFAYGLPSLFFWLDNVYEKHDLRPRCTTRIHTAANVWRYLYKAVVGDQWTAWHRFLGTSASFTFVLLWHTTQIHVVVWIAVNYFLVMAEMICARLAATAPVTSCSVMQGGSLGETALKGLLSAINLVATYGSCFFFLSNYDIASGAIKKLLVFPFPLLPVVLALYCNAQVAMDISDWERTRQPNEVDQRVYEGEKLEALSSSPCLRRKNAVPSGK
ncbi:hypothetical protein MRX96_022517 [Rhipicephalus microplus]